MAKGQSIYPIQANWMATEILAIMVMYWLVPLMTDGCMLYFKKRGPSTMPPAMPVHPQRTAATQQATERVAI